MRNFLVTILFICTAISAVASENEIAAPVFNSEIENLSDNLLCSQEINQIVQSQREEILPTFQKIKANYDRNDVNQTIKDEANHYFYNTPYRLFIGNNSKGLSLFSQVVLSQYGVLEAIDKSRTPEYVKDLFERLFQGEEIRDDIEVYYQAATPEGLNSEDIILTLEPITISSGQDLVQVNSLLRTDGSVSFAVIVNENNPVIKESSLEACNYLASVQKDLSRIATIDRDIQSDESVARSSVSSSATGVLE